MKIRLLTKIRKRGNAIFIVSISLFALCWLIIFPILFFFSSESVFAAILIMISAVCLFVSIISAVITRIFVKHIDLSADAELSLIINADESLIELTKSSDINYTMNFLTVDNVVFEIDNKQAFELYRTKKLSRIEVKYQQSKLLELSPKEIFNGIMEMLWAAS